MSDVAARIQGIEKVLKKLVILVDTHEFPSRRPSGAKPHKRRQSNWNKIRCMISELATSIQDVKEMVEKSGNSTSHHRTAGDEDHAATPAAQLPKTGQPPGASQLPGQNSSGTQEGLQDVGPVSVDPSAKADHQTMLTAQLSESAMVENHTRSTIPDQFCAAPTTVSTGAEGSRLGEDATMGVSVPHCSHRPAAAVFSQPDHCAPSISEVPRNHDLTIPYREEHGVIVLMPLNMDQCRDTAFLFSQAEALGARETGVFKYVLPSDFEPGAHAVPSITTRMSKFGSRLGPDDIFHISRTEDPETLEISESSFTPTEPDELSEMLERRLADPEAMSKMRYCTDLSAQTAEARRQLGLPAESPIWPLKGNLLDRTKYRVPGLHWPYGYVSGDDGSLFVIHREDGKLPSLNVLHRGREKLWYVVAQKDGHLVENEVKRGKCEQKVRHASRWIPRSKLRAMGASFVTLVQRPREVVVVWGDSYHQGGTVGPTVAEAVNYGGPDWSIEGYSECTPNCDGFPIPNAFLQFRDTNEPQREQEDETSRAAHESAQCEGRQRVARHAFPRVCKLGVTETMTNRNLQKRHRAPSPIRKLPGKRIRTMQSSSGTTIMAENSVWSAPISQMAKAICSTAAVKQFFEIVRGHRDLEPTALRMHPGRDLSTSHDPTQRLKNDVQTINVFSRKSAFHDFLIRLYQGRLAQHAEEIKQSRERIEKGGIAKILQGTGMDKRQFFHHRERGTKWREYCKMFPGILSFMLFQTQAFGFSSTDWVLLKTTDFDFLRRHLNTKDISALCCAGKKFEDSLDLTADDVEFVGESLSISLDKVSQTDLVSCLRTVASTDEMIYDQNAYPDWPRPEDWPADLNWPADPTSLPPTERQCEECDQDDCDCASRRPEIQPRIRIYEGKGRGLQAVAREAGHVAYRKAQRLGWFTGKLAPHNMYRNGRCYALFRDDLPFEPEVAQVNCAEISNIFRLMNHDCEPNVKFKGMRASGKYRIAIVATKDIRDGEEITVGYGKRFWGKERCPCPKCQSHAITPPT